MMNYKTISAVFLAVFLLMGTFTVVSAEEVADEDKDAFHQKIRDAISRIKSSDMSQEEKSMAWQRLRHWLRHYLYG